MKKSTSGKVFTTKLIMRIDEELLERLERFAEKRKWKKSFIVREALKEYFDRHENE